VAPHQDFLMPALFPCWAMSQPDAVTRDFDAFFSEYVDHGLDIMSKTANGPLGAVLHTKQRRDVDLGLNGDLTLFESGQRPGG